MGNCARNVMGGSHVETQSRGWLLQRDHPRVLHWPLDWQLELLKGVEEYQVVQQIVWVHVVVACFRQSSTHWTQMICEEELGTCIPTVFQGDITMILLNVVRIRRSNNYGVLHIEIQYNIVYISIY
jgi:hypothetical protein